MQFIFYFLFLPQRFLNLEDDLKIFNILPTWRYYEFSFFGFQGKLKTNIKDKMKEK
jgi:hypothetical protein